MINSTAVEARDKLLNWCGVLIVTKCNKFGSKSATVELLLSCYMDANSFLFHFTLTFSNQSWDAYILIRFISHFWPKINKQAEWWGGCNKNFLLCIFKTMSILDSTILVKLILPFPLNIDFQFKSFMAK